MTVRCNNDGKVYNVESGQLRHYSTGDIYASWGSPTPQYNDQTIPNCCHVYRCPVGSPMTMRSECPNCLQSSAGCLIAMLPNGRGINEVEAKTEATSSGGPVRTATCSAHLHRLQRVPNLQHSHRHLR